MYKIGVIGDKDSILGFKAVGLDVFAVETAAQAEETIRRLAQENYAVLFITEQLAQESQETIEAYKSSPFPAIILIPNNQGSLGLGMQGVKETVQKAIGVDILFEEKGR